METNRVVALLTPFAAAVTAGITSWACETLPLLDQVPVSAREELSLATAVAIVAMAWKWLQGWQQFEKIEADWDQLLAADEIASSLEGGADAAP